MTNDQKDDLILKRNYFEQVDRPLVQHHIKNLHSKQSRSKQAFQFSNISLLWTIFFLYQHKFNS